MYGKPLNISKGAVCCGLPAFGNNGQDIFEEGNCILTVNSKILAVILVALEVGGDDKDRENRIL
jgi:hypothetical protein